MPELIREYHGSKTMTRDHDEMITDLEPVWDYALYRPTRRPFDYRTRHIDASALGEEIERLTGIPGMLAHRLIICAWQVMNRRRSFCIFSLAENVALLTEVSLNIVLIALVAEDYIHWKNGMNASPTSDEQTDPDSDTEKEEADLPEGIGIDTLAAEIEKIIGLPSKISRQVLHCAWQVMKEEGFDGIYRLAQDVAKQTEEDEFICFLVLMTEDYLYWKNETVSDQQRGKENNTCPAK